MLPAPSRTLLAPLDFDMAFPRRRFLASVVEEAHQKLFPTEWEDLVRWEQNMGMRTSLAGSDFTSTGVSNSSTSPSKALGLVRCALRDTLVSSYDAALELDFAVDALPSESDADDSDAMTAAMRCIVQLALVLTHDSVV